MSSGEKFLRVSIDKILSKCIYDAEEHLDVIYRERALVKAKRFGADVKPNVGARDKAYKALEELIEKETMRAIVSEVWEAFEKINITPIY